LSMLAFTTIFVPASFPRDLQNLYLFLQSKLRLDTFFKTSVLFQLQIYTSFILVEVWHWFRLRLHFGNDFLLDRSLAPTFVPKYNLFSTIVCTIFSTGFQYQIILFGYCSISKGTIVTRLKL
jgi:uncharacterized membrane protein YciS (DUF1049 family)